MNQKRNRIIYLIATGLLTLLMLFSAGMYFFNYEMVAATFLKLGYPTHIIYPLATAKILGLLVIWTRKTGALKEWAYAGFFFDMVLASMAHININDGEYGAALIGIVLILVSYIFGKKLVKTVE